MNNVIFDIKSLIFICQQLWHEVASIFCKAMLDAPEASLQEVFFSETGGMRPY